YDNVLSPAYPCSMSGSATAPFLPPTIFQNLLFGRDLLCYRRTILYPIPRTMTTEIEQGLPLELRREPESLLRTIDAEGQFTFTRRSPGDRYFLNGNPIHAGDLLEMRLDDGAWQRVRFEWNPKFHEKPILCFDDERTMTLAEDKCFRWPGKERGDDR